MERIKQFLALDKPSFLIIVLPYFIFIWDDIYLSTFFSYSKLLLLPVILFISFIIDWSNRFFTYLENRKIYLLITLLSTLVIMILYYYSILIPTIVWIKQQIPTFKFNRRYAAPIIFIIFAVLQIRFNQPKSSYFFILNVLFINFSLLVTFNKIQSNWKDKLVNINQIKSSYLSIKPDNISPKPIILIIVDEYQSPNDLFSIDKDSSFYSFSQKLVQNGWIVKNKFHSHETFTIRSMSSLFNFNLSLDTNFSKYNETTVGSKLITANLYDTLVAKNCPSYNFGILDFGKTNRFLRKYYLYPTNINETLASKFIENRFVLYRLLTRNSTTINEDDYLHNSAIINSLPEKLASIQGTSFFAYAHLLMPHAPYQYGSEFEFLPENLNNYIKYWHFTNNKLNILLNQLIKTDKYRIILAGDHGFRFDEHKRMNPQNTFGTFWGFEGKDLEHIQSVQDLGSLINGYIKN